MPTDRLTPDRLAGFLSFLGSISPQSSDDPADVEAPDAPERPSEAVRSPSAETAGRKPERPESPGGPERPEAGEASRRDDSPPTAPLPAVSGRAVVAPDVAAPAAVAPEGAAPTVEHQVVTPAVAREARATDGVLEVGAEADTEPAVIAPDDPAAAESRTGRHRPPQSSRLSIRGFSLSARRLAMLAAVTVLVVVSVVLALT